MNSTFSGHFGYRRLLRVTLPSIVMMIFTSIYCVTDGFFVSNFAGKAAFTAVNFIMPYLMILGCVGFLFGTGGSALIGKTMGEGDRKHADRLFSMVICVTALSGLALGVLGIVLLRPVAELLGAEGELLENCVRYGRLILIANPAYVLQFAFQCLFATAGKPKLGLAVTVAAGVTNMVLDALFVGVFRWGIAGAAVATSLSQCVGGLLPLLYFLGKWNRSELHLTRFRFDGRALGRICGNGSSELMSNISMSLVGMLYNAQLMRYGGQNGIAAYGVLMYVSMIFHACFIGYAVGVSPVVSFHFGAQNRPELHSLLRKSLRLIGGSSIAMLAAGEPDTGKQVNPFTDVADDAWYTKAVIWAANNGIVNGVAKNTFAPDDSITREQIATMLYRYAGAEAATEDKLSAFPDAAKTSDWAKEALNWAVASGLINGVADANGTASLEPQSTATRAQIATILMRWLEK